MEQKSSQEFGTPAFRAFGNRFGWNQWLGRFGVRNESGEASLQLGTGIRVGGTPNEWKAMRKTLVG